MTWHSCMERRARRRLTVVLVRPSKYDDAGYVIRHWRGVLPSNTLACLHSLTEDLKNRSVLGQNLEIRIRIYDDTVQRIPLGRIIRSNRLPRNRTVVALVGVQSNQFPRAADLARRFREGGLQVLIGGFHVSGMLALFPEVSPEIKELLDLGVTVVKGEVEETWEEVLADALADRLKPIYDFLGRKPDLSDKPIPMIHRRYLKRFMTSNFGTIDCGRGCPYNCSFCTIINVQGHKVRFRSAEGLAGAIRANYRRHGIDYYFFTDDNFARNPCWRSVFEMLSRLRTEERIPVSFMIQVDTQSWKIPEFVQMASRAGCTQVFIGMESINPKNLRAAGKAQNKVQEYREMVAAWHEAKIATHVAYIIGFPFDTRESVSEDIDRLKRELGVEQASFFMLTPLPGSQDHARMVQAGEYMDPDLNSYDSFHETLQHPNFAPGAWYETYREAWRNFYSFDYMREVLAKAHKENYWNILRNFIWYKNSVHIEGGHPMIHGFFRIKSRTERRPGFAVESRWTHFRRRLRDVRGVVRQWVALLLEMEDLWLQTRKRSETELRLLSEVKRLREEVNRNLRAAELQIAYYRAKVHVPDLHVPSRLSLAFRDFNLSLAKRVTYSRADLREFWKRTWDSPRIRILLTPPHRLFLNLLRDAELMFLFAVAILRAED
ncbi:MAG: radical SAM protein [Acidobacteria bacterium]|nr:radical SAM protein [Acidobacteriota bacterium]